MIGLTGVVGLTWKDMHAKLIEPLGYNEPEYFDNVIPIDIIIIQG